MYYVVIFISSLIIDDKEGNGPEIEAGTASDILSGWWKATGCAVDVLDISHVKCTGCDAVTYNGIDVSSEDIGSWDDGMETEQSTDLHSIDMSKEEVDELLNFTEAGL